MAKAKFNLKDFMLRRGEVVVMGVAGCFLLIMLLWGASMWGSAKDPTQTVNELKMKVSSVHRKIEDTSVDEDAKRQLQQPAWVVLPNAFPTISPSEFAQSKMPMFSPVGQPSTKRDNPDVLPIGDFQVDMVRSAMIGHDIIPGPDGPSIAVLITQSAGEKPDEERIKKAKDSLDKSGQAIQDRSKKQPEAKQPQPKGPMGPGIGVGAKAGGDEAGNPSGLSGGGKFDQGGQRVEKAIKYIPLREIDAAIKNGNLPAFTVIPLRMVTVHAVVPYKQQLDEIKRALRLANPPPNAKKEDLEKSDAEAKQWGPWYDGFEVQRRITRILPNGEVRIIKDWPEISRDPRDTSGNYDFEDVYIDRIDTRKVTDHFDSGYIPYFLKPDLMLSMPLPKLAGELGANYPEIRLKPILDNIKRLEDNKKEKLSPSELAKQIQGLKTNKDLYKGKTGQDEGLGRDNKFLPKLGPDAKGAKLPTPPPLPMGGQRFPDGFAPPSGGLGVAEEVENFLLRFVDCAVEPGLTYEYRIRLRMINPNYGQEALVANPEFAKDSYKILYSKWVQLGTPITVPNEAYLFAHDVKAYRERIAAEYPTDVMDRDTKAMNTYLTNLLQVKDNQAVVQVATWMEQVLAGDGGKREPVGAWVVAEMPVGRGEFIGRRQYIKLPLWSSETEQYILREVTDRVVKGKHQPKGWMVDFSTQSVLVDFDGGRLETRPNIAFDREGNIINSSRTIREEVGTEMLIVQPDGKLIVRSSLIDDLNPTRRAIASGWERWVKEVEARKAPPSADDKKNPFDLP